MHGEVTDTLRNFSCLHAATAFLAEDIAPVVDVRQIAQQRVQLVGERDGIVPGQVNRAHLTEVVSPRECLALPSAPFLYAILDASMTGSRSLTEWVSLIAGEDRAPVLQWRFKGLADAEALEGARELRTATRERGVLFFVNDRPDIARMVGADGVHVGQDDLDPADVRLLLPEALIGVSTHNPRQFEAALGSPADYIAVGPVFGTASKANPDPVVGVEFVAWAASRTDRPVVAIGGLNASNAASVVRAGARGLSVISELMKAHDPAEAARVLARDIRNSAR